MNIHSHIRNLTLASMLAFSVMSPLAVHVHAQDNGSGSGGPSVPGDCKDKDQAYQNAKANDDGTHTQFPKGQNIPNGTTLQAVDPNGNVNQNATYKCKDSNIGLALIIQPGHFRPVAPSSGATALP